MNESMEYNTQDYNPVLGKWLKNLFLLGIASAVIVALTAIPALTSVLGWVSRVIGVGIILALFRLAPANGRYRKAAIFQCIVVGVGLFSSLLQISLFSLAASVCSIIAQYQEYHGHSEVVAGKDTKLSDKWRSLFYVQFAVGIIVGMLSASGVVIAALAGVETNAIVTVFLLVSTALSTLIQVFYLIYLKKTADRFAAQ